MLTTPPESPISVNGIFRDQIGAPVLSGTSGSVLFVDSNITLAQDNANFFWDATNHRLGIGTTSPDANLTIFRGAAGVAFDVIGTAGGLVTDLEIDLQLKNVNTVTYTRLGVQASNGVAGSETGAFYISTVNAGTLSEKVRVTAPGAIYQTGAAAGTGYLRTNSGNLASTTNLNPGIVVFGGAVGGNSYGMDLGYTGSSYRARVFAGTGQDVVLAIQANTNFAAQTDFTELLVAKSSGDVGIGIALPLGRIHTQGAISSFNKWEYDGVDGTARTVGNGVVYSSYCIYLVRGSGGTVTSGTAVTAVSGTNAIYNLGGDTLQLAVSAGGAITVQRTAGTLTYKVSLLTQWI